MASIIKVDNVQNTPGTNIASKCGTTITLGACGDTVSLASGASQTGFGRTGTVDWITTPKVTGDSPVTGVTGKGYFMNTTAGTITINLPAGVAGSIISVMDYAGTWDSNNLTVSPNGSEKIGGVNADVDLNTAGQSVTFVYVDSTQGWLNTMDSTSNVRANNFIVATGGTPCAGEISGDYKYHTFTGPGTFCVSAVGPGSPDQTDEVSYVVVAGGGGGAGGVSNAGAGGGAGGFREGKNASDPYADSPLDSGTAITVTATGYPITVGAGGCGSAPPASGNQGSTSTFSTIDSAGGGAGGRASAVGGAGGSGGGGGGGSAAGKAGGAGNTPPTPVAQGTAGGTGGSPAPDRQAGGGGGATVAGTDATPPQAGPGGDGATSSINATPTARAGGGGGGGSVDTPNVSGAGGAGGGGIGGCSPGAGPGGGNTGNAGTVNTGGGGGGGANCNPGGNGGSGTVIIRYKFQ